MCHSTGRILTTDAASLPRPPGVREEVTAGERGGSPAEADRGLAERVAG